MLQSRLPSATDTTYHSISNCSRATCPSISQPWETALSTNSTFNDYSRVVVATGDAAASYSIDNIALEFDMVTQPDLARQIRNQYAGRLAVLYERVLRHRKITANKSDTLWNINLNVPARSMSGILMLFEEPAAAFQRDTEAFYNPKIEKVEVCIEGIPNQLYSQGMRAYQLWGEARKHFAAGTKRHPEVAAVREGSRVGRRIPGPVSDLEACPVAGPPHHRWRPTSRQRSPGWER